jgi:hypothetical protein
VEGRAFKDASLIESLCNRSAGKAKLYFEEQPGPPPDIIHLACHTKGDDQRGFDFSGIDPKGKTPLNVDSAVAKIRLWSGCCGGEDKLQTLLIFFNACYSADVGRAVIQKMKALKLKPPHFIAWEEEVPNALCNDLAKEVYCGTLMNDWSRNFKFEMFFDCVKTLAMESKFVMNLSEPIRGEGTVSIEKIYVPTLLSPDEKDPNNLMKVNGMDPSGGGHLIDDGGGGGGGMAVVDATPVVDTAKQINTKTQPRYEMMDEPIKSWIERAVFGKPNEPVELEQWSCCMKLRDDEKQCVLKTLKSLGFDKMDLVDAMEEDDLANFKNKLEGSSAQVLTSTLLCF